MDPEFIKEPPVLKSRMEIKPFKSEPLRMVPQRDDDDDEEDNPGAYDIDTAPDIGELDDFEPDGGEGWTDESSSGVSFEELSETADVLAAEEPSAEERQKAAAVLDTVDGTELFNFIAMNEVYAEKARALISAFKEQNGNARQEVFDMGKYME